MPGLDGTGPGGQGPMTGGGFGRCTDSANSTRPIGRGLGGGRRRGNRYNAASNNQPAAGQGFAVSAMDDGNQANEDFAGLEMKLKQVQEQNEILTQENKKLKSSSKK